MEVFYLVMIFSSSGRGGIDTIPLPFISKEACQISGEEFKNPEDEFIYRGDTFRYLCIPAILDRTMGVLTN